MNLLNFQLKKSSIFKILLFIWLFIIAMFTETNFNPQNIEKYPQVHPDIMKKVEQKLSVNYLSNHTINIKTHRIICISILICSIIPIYVILYQIKASDHISNLKNEKNKYLEENK